MRTRSSTSSINPKTRLSNSVTIDDNLSVKSNQYSSSTSAHVPPAYSTTYSTDSVGEASNQTRHMNLLETAERDKSSKNWLKKMWKKSNQTKTDKKKVKAVAA